MTQETLKYDVQNPKFAQIYIHDSAYELQNRASNFSDINLDTLRQLQDLMHSMNPFVQLYKSMIQIAEEQCNTGSSSYATNNGINELNEVKMIFRAEGLPDRRRYNRPTGDPEIGMIIVGGEGSSDNEATFNRDIVVQLKGDRSLSRINETNQYYDPLHYVLLHPERSAVWNIETKSLKEPFNKVSFMAYYSSRLMITPYTGNLLHLFGKLFHQYIVDMYAKM